MTKLELEIRTRDAAWKPSPGKGNASIAARDRRTLLRVIDALRAVNGRFSAPRRAPREPLPCSACGGWAREGQCEACNVAMEDCRCPVVIADEAYDPFDGARATDGAA